MEYSNPEKDWHVIINPNAGHRKGEKDWKYISSLLDRHFHYGHIFTKERHHAIALTQDCIRKGLRNLIVVGGDGTINEVVNGIFLQKDVPADHITLGAILVGTGNDWGRMFGIPKSYEEAVAVLHRKKTFRQDTGILRFYNNDCQTERYFINMAGLGFDAVVAKRANVQKDRGRSGIILYFLNILTNLWKFHHIHTHIRVDGQELKDDVFTMSIGIGRYSGGGMIQTPDSIPDDGMFDVTVIKKMGKLQIIRSLPLLYNGKILKHPRVVSFRGKKIFIQSESEIQLEADGESLGHSPVELEIIPQSLCVITGDHQF